MTIEGLDDFRNSRSMRIGLVVTSRSDSSRVTNKPFRKLNGVPIIEHLLSRCIATGVGTTLAVPIEDFAKYEYLTRRFPNLKLVQGEATDPMARLLLAAVFSHLDAVIRVTHDKIFIDPDLVQLAIETFKRKNLDYLYSSDFTPGSGFEIISTKTLHDACSKHKDVEYISYAVKNVTRNSHNLAIPHEYKSNFRFLIDYPEDLDLLEVILSHEGNSCSLLSALNFMQSHGWARKLNELPLVTVYTCAYNAGKWLEKAMGSVAEQIGFKNMEYILVDDFSSDNTPLLMAKMQTTFHNVRFIRNPKNVGLASSSNVALSEARGKFIVRLDADDYFVGRDAVSLLVKEIEETGKDAIYPHNYFGNRRHVQNGKESHHVGGAMFRRSAINHLKFTEMLRGYEGYDFFERAKNTLNIGYLGVPVFLYRQRDDSLTKQDPAERARIKAEIDARNQISTQRH